MKSKPKVVFDTNIYVSAIIFGGNPRTCLELARSRGITVFTTYAILFELAQKLKNKFGWSDEDVFEVVEGLLKFVLVVIPKTEISVIKKDQSDNKILECAKEAQADFIVSGDTKHVLPLKKFENTKIVSARNFLDEYFKSN